MFLYHSTSNHRHAHQGFTLIELSVVLLIIGLLVGGTLVGTNLLNAAKIRSQIKDLETYQTAISAFKTKYQGLPGDVENARDLLPVHEIAAIANGDGNNRLEDSADSYTLFDDEIAQFWMQLAASKLLDGGYTTNGVTGEGFPETAFGRGGIYAFYDNASGDITHHGANVFFFGITGTVDPGTDDTVTTDAVLNPEEAWKIDEKMDDGNPYFGLVRARDTDFGDPSHYDYAMKIDSNNPIAEMALLFGEWLVPPAHALAASASACTYFDADGGDLDAAYTASSYAYQTKGLTCLLSVQFR